MRTTLAALADQLSGGEISPLTHINQHLARIHRQEPAVRAWAHVGATAARRAAHGAPSGPFHGLCCGVKDIFDTADMPTALGSPLYAGRQPGEDAALVSLLRNKGAVVLGKTETAGFAYFDPAPTRNPWNLAHTPGGSSSGSAAAVAAGMTPFALGTQTQGSVLRPASYCGVVGFKPSFGALPVGGILPFAPSLDHPGFFAACAESMAWLWSAITDTPKPEAREPRRAVVPKWPLEGSLDPRMATSFERLLERLSAAGWQIDQVGPVDEFEGLMSAIHCVFAYEGARTHRERYAEHGAAIGAKLAALVERGLAITDSEHAAALDTFAQAREAFSNLCRGDEVWLTPAALDPAPTGLGSTGDPAANSPFTALGTPALAVPMGTDSKGMPLGVQIAGAGNQEATVLAAGLAIGELIKG